MERALLVRHGQSEYSARELVNGDPAVACPLTDEGRAQSRRLGERIAGEPIDLCVVTEFGRTQETADLALAGRDVPRVVVPELNDPYYGEFEGRALADYRTWARSHGPTDVPPGRGEARVAIVERYVRGFRLVVERPENTVLVVCHSLPIAFAVAAAHGRDPTASMPLVMPAEPHVLDAAQLAAAVERLESWLREPAYR